MKGRILIIEDDPNLGQMLDLDYADHGYEIDLAASCSSALASLAQQSYELILLDQHLPDGTGYELLQQLKEMEPHLPVIMMTAIHDLDLAINSVKAGASDFIHKPFKFDELLQLTRKTLEHRRLQRKLSVLQEESSTPDSNPEFIGRSQGMVEVSKRIAL